MTNEQALIYRKHKEAAKKLLHDFPSCGTMRSKGLTLRLRKEKKQIQRIKKAAFAADVLPLPLPKAYEWMADNYYLLDERFHVLPHEFAHFKHIQRECRTVEPLPRYYLVFLHYTEYLERNAYAVDEFSLNAFFAALFSEETTFPHYEDIESFPTLFTAAVVHRMASICQSLSSGTLSQDKAGEKLGFGFSSLHHIDAFPFERCFAYSETERYLCADPSGDYLNMTEETKNFYRKRVAYLAGKAHTSETTFAQSILEKACTAEADREKHIGFYLMPHKSKPISLYFFLLGVLTLSGVCFLMRYTLWGVLAIFPLWEAAKMLLDRLFGRFVKSERLPRMEVKALGENEGVLTVITTLLGSEKRDDELFEHLENLYLSCGMPHTYFGILGDFSDASHESDHGDEATLDFAQTRIRSLNQKYGEHFYLFLRPRRYCKTQNAFIGYERKRGAVMQLVHFLCTGEKAFLPDTALMTSDIAKKIRYVVTLDADTNLPLDAVKALVGTMLHPLNRPVIDRQRHCVISGYGILQPRVGPDLSAAEKTPFSRVMCGIGGTEIYAFTGFDFYQSLFGRANFCGKGILDKYAFEETINNADGSFPEDSILSHDILEGERMRTALVEEPTVTDGFPKNALSYFRRHHRWVRGDMQNLLFCAKSYRNAHGTLRANTFSALSKFKLFDNVRRESVPIFSLAGLLIANFLSPKAAFGIVLASLLYLLLPFAWELVRLFGTLGFSSAARRFFSKGVYAGIWQSFLRFLFSVSALFKEACVTLDAMFRSLWRMTVSRQGLLEWVTAAQSDSVSENDLLGYVQKNLLGACIGAGQFILSPYGTLKLIGLMWFFFPAVAYFCGKETEAVQKHTLSEKQKNTLRQYAADTWKMYENTVSHAEHDLPPDNLQLTPVRKIAHRTSPTNIGLYLASILAARDFDFISNEELYRRLNAALDTVERLPKWQGHLYNWYDTQSLTVLEPPYVSSVDSGNFLACLIALSEGLKEYASQEVRLLELVNRVSVLIQNTDLRVLYNENRALFVLGISFDEAGHAQQTEYVFDMLMSEARTLSYIAVACRAVPAKHWFTLSRPLIKKGSRVGVASWTGTAFEYFMPSLFLPARRSSLLYEALRFAFFAQRKRCAALANGQKAWGISESGYYAFDSDDNYLYQAFGVPILGYKRGLDKDLVLAPYASFLMLCMNAGLPLNNLAHLKNNGVYGAFGFYEAIDFTPERTDCREKAEKGRIVQSYMAHHVGMSLLACANAVSEDCFVRRFMQNPLMRSACELLEEKIPVDAVIRRVKYAKGTPERSNRTIG